MVSESLPLLLCMAQCPVSAAHFPIVPSEAVSPWSIWITGWTCSHHLSLRLTFLLSNFWDWKGPGFFPLAPLEERGLVIVKSSVGGWPCNLFSKRRQFWEWNGGEWEVLVIMLRKQEWTGLCSSPPTLSSLTCLVTFFWVSLATPPLPLTVRFFSYMDAFNSVAFFAASVPSG